MLTWQVLDKMIRNIILLPQYFIMTHESSYFNVCYVVSVQAVDNSNHLKMHKLQYNICDNCRLYFTYKTGICSKNT